MKDRIATEEQIITALDRVILKSGFTGLGVNAVAREAGVSKVLIYRYFGSFDGLLEVWALENSYWTTLPENGAGAEEVLSGQIDSLRRDRLKREIQRWLLAEQSPVGDAVMHRLEESGLALSRRLAEKEKPAKGVDAEAAVAVITAGITHLALMSDRADVYNGVRLDSDEGWERLRSAVKMMMRSMLAGPGR